MSGNVSRLFVAYPSALILETLLYGSVGRQSPRQGYSTSSRLAETQNPEYSNEPRIEGFTEELKS